MQTRVACMVLLAALGLGCSGETAVAPGDPSNDPNDPVICVGDPDSNVTCKKQSEFWDCTSLPNADTKCNFKQPLAPSGSGGRSCAVEGGKVVCNSSTPNLPGGAGWTCTSDQNGTTCVMDAPTPPGGGSYESGSSCRS